MSIGQVPQYRTLARSRLGRSTVMLLEPGDLDAGTVPDFTFDLQFGPNGRSTFANDAQTQMIGRNVIYLEATTVIADLDYCHIRLTLERYLGVAGVGMSGG